MKNEIIKHLTILFPEYRKDREDLTIEDIVHSQQAIISHLDTLVTVFPDEVEYIENILLDHYKYYLRISSVEYIDSVYALGNILMHLSKTSTSIQRSSFFANKIYALVEDDSYPKTFVSNYLTLYLTHLSKETTLPLSSIQSVERHHITSAAQSLKIGEKEFIQELEYLAYFLKAVISNSSLENEKKDIKSYLVLLEQYIRINSYIQKFYVNTKTSSTIDNTISIEYKEILDRLLSQLTKTFFINSVETKENPLTLAQELPDITSIKRFENDINTMIKFIENYSTTKDDTQKRQKEDIQKLKTMYYDYFYALQQYDVYIDQFQKDNPLMPIDLEKPTPEQIQKEF